MITCVRCKSDYPDGTDFGGHKICPKCYSKQALGRANYSQKQEVKQMAEQKADETYLQVEPVRARPKRTPLTARQQLARSNTPDGFVERWFNVKPGSIEAAEEAGWSTVKRDERGGVKMVEGGLLPGGVTQKPVGQGVTAVLMRKPKDEYDEDMALTEQRNMQKEAAILAPEEQNSAFYTRKDVPIRVGAGLHERQIKPIR